MDLSFLKPLYAVPGPFASVYADLTRTSEEAPKAPELRWRALREELVAQHAPPGTVRAIERAVGAEIEERRSDCLVVFAAGDDVVLLERLPEPPGAQLARFAPLPHVMPLLAARGERVPHLVAVADRLGAEVTCVPHDDPPRTVEVHGDEDFPIRKTKEGGWSQPRYQRAAENTWRANAKKIGHEIDRLAADCGAEVVVVAGDVRARSAVIEELSEGVLARTVESDRGARAEGADETALEADVSRIVELKTAERVDAIVARFHRELAHGQRAVQGLAATSEALRRGQVETLLLAYDPASDARLWVGREPGHLAADPEELRRLGAGDLVQDHADAALVRAAAATDAELIILPVDGAPVENGVGAVLRYTDAVTP